MAHATCSVCLVGVLRETTAVGETCSAVWNGLQLSSRCMTRPGTVNLAIKCGLGFMIGFIIIIIIIIIFYFFIIFLQSSLRTKPEA